jgi:amino acid transporter
MSSPAPRAPRPALKRAISLPLLVLYGLGTIVGGGIYVLIGAVAARAGMYAPIAFLVAGVVAALTAFSYAELSSRYPYAAGEAIYVEEGFGLRPLSLAVGLLLVLTGVVSSATLARGFAGYLEVFVPVPHALAATCFLGALGAIAIWGIRESALFAAAATLIEVSGLVLVLAVAAPKLGTLPERVPELLPPLQAAPWIGIVLGAFIAFYAFLGFEDMVNVAEEVRDPEVTLPRAIVMAFAVSTALYLLVALAAVLALPLADLAASNAPLALLYQRATGAEPVAIALVGLFAVANGAMVQIIMGARVLYGMSASGWLPAGLASVHAGTRTPYLATALMALVALAFALWLPLVALAQLTSLAILIVFALVHAALLRIKRRWPAAAGTRTVPIAVPAAGLAVTLALLAAQLTQLVPGPAASAP